MTVGQFTLPKEANKKLDDTYKNKQKILQYWDIGHQYGRAVIPKWQKKKYTEAPSFKLGERS